jgi:hypothetical protein
MLCDAFPVLCDAVLLLRDAVLVLCDAVLVLCDAIYLLCSGRDVRAVSGASVIHMITVHLAVVTS